MKTVYKLSLHDFNTGNKNWVANVKTILDNQGLSYIFNTAESANLKVIPNLLKQTLIDTFKQNWFSVLERSPVLSLYRHIKSDLHYETYLDIIPNNLRFFISRYRISAHSLRIQTGRYARNRLDRHLRICQLCDNGDIEDEFHFIFVCRIYNDIRKKYIKKSAYIRPSVFKLVQLFQTSDRSSLVNLSLFLKKAISLRTSLLNRS